MKYVSKTTKAISTHPIYNEFSLKMSLTEHVQCKILVAICTAFNVQVGKRIICKFDFS